MHEVYTNTFRIRCTNSIHPNTFIVPDCHEESQVSGLDLFVNMLQWHTDIYVVEPQSYWLGNKKERKSNKLINNKCHTCSHKDAHIHAHACAGVSLLLTLMYTHKPTQTHNHIHTNTNTHTLRQQNKRLSSRSDMSRDCNWIDFVCNLLKGRRTAHYQQLPFFSSGFWIVPCTRAMHIFETMQNVTGKLLKKTTALVYWRACISLSATLSWPSAQSLAPGVSSTRSVATLTDITEGSPGRRQSTGRDEQRLDGVMANGQKRENSEKKQPHGGTVSVCSTNTLLRRLGFTSNGFLLWPLFSLLTL